MYPVVIRLLQARRFFGTPRTGYIGGTGQMGRFSRADVHGIFGTLEEDPSVCNVNFGGLMRGGCNFTVDISR